MPIIKKPFSLAPLNDNPAVLTENTLPNMKVSGGFSSKGGFPTIKFSIPPQPAMLEMTSLKLVGQILIKGADNNVVIADNTGANYANGADVYGAGNWNGGAIQNNGATMLKQTGINLPNWGGVKNVIDKVVVQSKKSLIELTQVNNYGQYTALTEAYSHNTDDYLIEPLTKSLSGGTNAARLNRRMLACATIGDNQAHSIKTANDRMIGQFFSIPIQVDLMNQETLFLDDDYLGGLLITLHLASDGAVFHNRFSRVGATNSAALDFSALSYVLKNIRLEGKYVVPDEQDMANIPPVMSLDSRLNLINDIHSSINANAYTPQLQSVKSVSSVFLDSDQTNTFKKNQNNFRPPVGLASYQQARNGLRFPYNYETFSKPNQDNQVAGASEKTLQFPALAYGDAEVRIQFENSLLNGNRPYHSVAGIGLTNSAIKQDIDDAALGAGDIKNDNCAADVFGVGADYTLGLGLTQNFVNQDYNLTLKSRVNTGDANVSAIRNGAGVSNPLLQQSFLRYNSQFDTQSLVKII